MLLHTIRTSLVELEKGIKGLVVMSSDLEEVFTCIHNAQVPPQWSKVRNTGAMGGHCTYSSFLALVRVCQEFYSMKFSLFSDKMFKYSVQLFPLVFWHVGFPVLEASWSMDTRPGAQGGADCYLGHHHSSPCALLAVRVHLSNWISYCCVTDCCQEE